MARDELLDASAPDLDEGRETLAAIREGLNSIEAGEGMELAAIDAMLRKKQGFSSKTVEDMP